MENIMAFQGKIREMGACSSEDNETSLSAVRSSEEQALHDELVRVWVLATMKKSLKKGLSDQHKQCSLLLIQNKQQTETRDPQRDQQPAVYLFLILRGTIKERKKSPQSQLKAFKQMKSGFKAMQEEQLQISSKQDEIKRIIYLITKMARRLIGTKYGSPNISFMRPFGCPLTILNTLDQLGKFDGKSEEGYLLGYSTSSKGFRVYNRVTRKVQDCLHVDFLENQENQKGKGPDWMFDLELLTPSMNYIPVRKENYADSGGKVSTYDDVEDLDDQQFIVHDPSIAAVQNKHSEERTADKEVPLSTEDQALHDELVSLMHQESIAKIHNDAQRNVFEEEKRRIALEKGKDSANSTFTLSTANTPSQSTGNTPTDSDDDVPKDDVFSTNSFDAENTEK
ncbi:hypothetical protein Tco_0178472 [Tanacetum coccineum]